MNQDKPLLFFAKTHNPEDLEKWLELHPQVQIVDSYQLQLRELFETMFPAARGDEQKMQHFLTQKLDNHQSSEIVGTWVYYPWKNVMIHLLAQQEYYDLRTNRNRELISRKEQEKLHQFKVAVFGMSIGSVIARAIIQGGCAQQMTICDNDQFAISNFNRVPVDIFAIGQFKAERIAQDLYQLDPFLDLNVLKQKATKNSLKKLMDSPYKPQLIIDAIDDFPMKVLLRLEAKRNKIPLLMCTNLGDSVLIDIERHDLEDVAPFHGLVKSELLAKIMNEQLPPAEKKQLAVTLVGKHHVPLRARYSVQQLGKTLAGRPQFFSSVAVGAGLASFVVRQIALHKKIGSQQTRMHFPTLFGVEDMMEKI